MEQILPQHWTYLYFGLIFAITCAQILVVYILSSSSNPPAGLGLYTVYFMAAMLGWFAVALQQGPAGAFGVDVPAVAMIINSYILFLAAGQRARCITGRLILGLVCLSAVLSVFFAPPQRMFFIQITTMALFFAATGALCARRAWQQHNSGDAIAVFAALIMVLGTATAIYHLTSSHDMVQSQAIAFGVHSAAYVLVAIGFLASVLVEYQQHLSHLATEDALTGLLNRRGMEETLHLSLAQAARQGLPTSALLVDIDHFKRINDGFGNDVGDQVIRQVARSLERASRATDVVARTGGEEYLLILPQTDLEAARVLAERIRAGTSEQALLARGQRVPVTVSIGVATVTGEVDLDALNYEARRALHLAKRGGRNQVASVQTQPLRFQSAAV